MDSHYSEIAYEIEGAVVTLTLDRPEQLNAITTRMVDELVDSFERAGADDAVRAIVVTGRGRAFSVGADLSRRGSSFESHHDSAGKVALAVYACPKPVIAAVNGPAVGFGVTFILPMDVRLASTAARFGFVFSRRGIVPEAGSTWFLPRIVGMGQALEWMESGRVFDASEAIAGGLVRSLHEPDRLLDDAYTLAREMTEATSAISVAAIRRMLWRGLGEPDPSPALLRESRLLWHLGHSPEAREGIESFLERRPARFTLKLSKDYPAELLE